ncbi:MAG: phosphatase PAP2 family protein, partial [Pseudolysinimonas sp.]
MTALHSAPRSRLRRFHEKFLVDVRVVPARVRLTLYLVAIALVAVGLVAFFVILSAVLQHDGLSAIDAPIEKALDATRTGWITTLMIVIAVAFGPIALPIIILVVTVVWSILGMHLWRPLLLAAGTLTGVIVVQLIAHAVQRQRPPVALMLFGQDLTFSFPSGHVMGASNFLLLTTYLVFSRRTSPKAPVIGFAVA